ncbi:ice-binding family protein [Nocardioides pacificus]
MSPRPRTSALRPSAVGTAAASLAALLVGGLALVAVTPAHAADPIGLGTARSYAVLAASKVANTGGTVVSGDLGLTGTDFTGFPPGVVTDGTTHITDAEAARAALDANTGYLQAAAAPTDSDLTGSDLGGMTLTPGVYEDTSTLQLTGALTLDGQGDPDAVFILKAGSSLTTAPGARVVLTGAASPCNVFWQVTSSATLDTDTEFVGTVMALASITVNNGATIEGAVLALNGAVTLDDNVITQPGCADRVAAPTSSATPTASPSPTAAPTAAPTRPSATETITPSSTPSPAATVPGTSSHGDVVVPSGHPETGRTPSARRTP